VITAQVKHALIQDGWTITADPYTITFEDAQLFADLAAERPNMSGRSSVGRLNRSEIAFFVVDLETEEIVIWSQPDTQKS